MNMHLKIYNKTGDLVSDIRTRKKRRILYFIQADTTPEAKFYIKVNYSKGCNNIGEYFSKQDLLLALSAFTEGGYEE
jgi:hypothetical protein